MRRRVLVAGSTVIVCLVAAAPASAKPAHAGPEVARVGALLNDIQQLDLQSHSYAVDIYIWFKWDDPEIDPSSTSSTSSATSSWS